MAHDGAWPIPHESTRDAAVKRASRLVRHDFKAEPTWLVCRLALGRLAVGRAF